MRERLVFEKIKDLHCNNCFFYPERRCQFGSIFMCSGSDAYRLVEEPEEIQSEYDWKNERYEILSNSKNRDHMKEIYDLEKWLKDNPKECWETCTKENTKVGDEVFLKNGNYGIARQVDFIFRCGMECVLTFNDTGGQDKCRLYHYEINTNKQGDE